MKKANLKNVNEKSRQFYKKTSSLISNKDKRDKIIRFLNAYIASEYVAKTIQLLLEGKELTESNYISTSITPTKIKKYYCNNGCTFDDLQYVFNPKSHNNKKTCRIIRNKIVHCFDEACINLILKDDFYINTLSRIKYCFE